MAQSAPTSPADHVQRRLAFSEPLRGTSELTPPDAAPHIEHAVRGFGIAVARLVRDHGRGGPTLSGLSEAAHPIAGELGTHVTAWPWTLPQAPPTPREVLFIEYVRLLNYRLHGGVKELTFAIVMLQDITVRRPRWVQRRTIRVLLVVLLVLARKAVADKSVRTSDCWRSARVAKVVAAPSGYGRSACPAPPAQPPPQFLRRCGRRCATQARPIPPRAGRRSLTGARSTRSIAGA